MTWGIYVRIGLVLLAATVGVVAVLLEPAPPWKAVSIVVSNALILLVLFSKPRIKPQT